MNDTYALVTGSSDRIGRSIALKLADLGYHLILHYNTSEKKAVELKNEIESMGRKAEVIGINFSDIYDFDFVFNDLSKRLTIEILVNNASDFYPSDFEKKGTHDLNHFLKVNFESAYSLTKSFARVFRKGLIINLLDTNVEKYPVNYLDYILGKKLLKEFTKLSAVALGPDIRVNAIAPGLVLPPEGKDMDYLLEKAERIPLKRVGSPEKIQETVAFLIRNDFLTGQIIYVDGGEHI